MLVDGQYWAGICLVFVCSYIKYHLHYQKPVKRYLPVWAVLTVTIWARFWFKQTNASKIVTNWRHTYLREAVEFAISKPSQAVVLLYSYGRRGHCRGCNKHVVQDGFAKNRKNQACIESLTSNKCTICLTKNNQTDKEVKVNDSFFP